LTRQGCTHDKHCIHIYRYQTTTVSSHCLRSYRYGLWIVTWHMYQFGNYLFAFRAMMSKYMISNARDLRNNKDHKDYIVNSLGRDAKHKVKVYPWAEMERGRESPIDTFERRMTSFIHGCCCDSCLDLERQGVTSNRVLCTKLHKNRHDLQQRIECTQSYNSRRRVLDECSLVSSKIMRLK
jgi:hypothetical protein